MKELIEVCLYKSYFLWDNQIHCLEDSGPIGLSLMVVLAESYLQMIENQALNISRSRAIPVGPITHRRYVDDSHDRFVDKEKSDEFLTILNSQDERVQFTVEYENSDKELNYLEITTINNKQGNYDFKVYRKDAITNIQIKPESCYDDKIKRGVFKGFILRAKNICSEKYLDQEINFIKQIFIENGYDEAILDKIIQETKTKKSRKKNDTDGKYTSLPWIPGLSQKLQRVFKNAGCKVSFKSPRNLESILTSRNKPKLPPNSQPGVYFVPTGCASGYTRESKRQIRTRNLEHERAVFKGDTKGDAIAEHKDSCECQMNWDAVKTLAVEPVRSDI